MYVTSDWSTSDSDAYPRRARAAPRRLIVVSPSCTRAIEAARSPGSVMPPT